MKKNVGTLDRIVRAALGLALLYFAFLSGATALEMPVLKFGVAAVGLIMLGVAAVRVCPIYRVFGFKTCRV